MAAIGVKIKMGIQAAATAGSTNDSANFSNSRFKNIKLTKKPIEISRGIPNPPLRIMAPIGPPIKRNRKQINAFVSFEWSI